MRAHGLECVANKLLVIPEFFAYRPFLPFSHHFCQPMLQGRPRFFRWKFIGRVLARCKCLTGNHKLPLTELATELQYVGGN